VAQIAKSIAIGLNHTVPFFKKHPIDTDLIETISLAHDLGHPPFGHNGEKALDDCMKAYGGFEGNAQTLRILSRLEKRDIRDFSNVLPPGITEDGRDDRLGLNLTYRTLAGVLKYDRCIPIRRKRSAALIKGYYASEEPLAREIKRNVLNRNSLPGFKTVECAIMDVSDDIAYSIYDLEDSFKAGFTSPLDMLAISDDLATRVAKKISQTEFPRFTKWEVIRVIRSVFEKEFGEHTPAKGITVQQYGPVLASHYLRISDSYASDGYLRSIFTSRLVTEFIQGVEVEINGTCPAVSKIALKKHVLEKVEVLKHYTYQNLIMSPRLKVAEYRGYDIVTSIFKALNRNKGFLLMPNDFQDIYSRMPSTLEKKRVICDFIAGMTDRYAVEFYGRLYSENAQTIFKPL
jgi:dGTPase